MSRRRPLVTSPDPVPGERPTAGPRRLLQRMAEVVPAEQWTDLRQRLGRYRPGETGFRYGSAALGPGERAGPPDFVGIGVPAAGWRWWSTLVAEHPGVSGPRVPGMATHFLSQFAVRPLDPEMVALYHGLFPRRPGVVAGEWTPTYLGDPWVTPLLGTVAPEAKVLCLVRDPVERMRHGLRQTAGRRAANAGAHTAEAVDRGFYARPLKRLLEVVPADRVMVLQFERCVADPARELERTDRFLGLPPEHRLEPPGPAPASAPLPTLDEEVERRLVELYAPDVADLATLAPGLDLALWPRFAGRR